MYMCARVCERERERNLCDPVLCGLQCNVPVEALFCKQQVSLMIENGGYTQQT